MVGMMRHSPTSSQHALGIAKYHVEHGIAELGISDRTEAAVRALPLEVLG
jgi:hypothetical protein